ncbi:rhodanese [Paenibacillus sp. 598K]|uniref:rhodanese-like domain-containing protein n=1 Tax=Paenibacillus sp. 598K TaxID=1117987 RepID=UPI000FF931CD|nr:rhodanese-like domain-containing protein [Paenibacillus sp. 598K]GBF77738.1 rhodanese [Paenibacillus sp. 598K]
METVRSLVLETPAASPEQAHRHYINKLSVETDASDVCDDLKNGVADFLFVDVRSARAYEECHAVGAINLPSDKITAETTAGWDKKKLIVVYCWGPACNGAAKSAASLSALGFQVKEMLGGIEYWRREGHDVEGKLA